VFTNIPHIFLLFLLAHKLGYFTFDNSNSLLTHKLIKNINLSFYTRTVKSYTLH